MIYILGLMSQWKGNIKFKLFIQLLKNIKINIERKKPFLSNKLPSSIKIRRRIF